MRPSVGLMPTRPFAADGADDGSVRFGSNANRGEVCRNRRTSTRTGTARIAIQRVGVLDLTAAAAPAAGGMRGSEVRPLAQVRLSENDDAGGAETLHQEGIRESWLSFERQRTGGGLHAIGRIDVVLDEHRNPVQRAPGTFRAPLGIECVGDRSCVGIDLDDRSQLGSAPVDLLDPFQIQVRQLPGGVTARCHPLLELGRGGFLERKRRRR